MEHAQRHDPVFQRYLIQPHNRDLPDNKRLILIGNYNTFGMIYYKIKRFQLVGWWQIKLQPGEFDKFMKNMVEGMFYHKEK
jgi:hypothetical protein